MKKLVFILVLFILLGCSSTKFVDSWRNKEITSFKPNRILVIGVTDNLTARKIFEEKLKQAFILRNINADESLNVINKTFTSTQRTEEEINDLIEGLALKGYDAVLITTLKGVEEKRSYTEGYYTVNYNWTRFGRYYYRFQDIYYTPQYYEKYNVYHVESSIYNLKEEENKSLVWVGAFDVVNPQTISTTINDYVIEIVKQLEQEQLIRKL
jgi:hypothetical protein